MFRRGIVALVLVAFPATTALGQLIYFDNQADFEAFNANGGKVLKGVETFEENTLGPNNIGGLDPILEPGVPNGPFPNGLTDVDNIFITTQSPDGVPSMGVVITDGFFGAVTSIVGADTFGETTSIHMLDDDKTAIGFDTQILADGNGMLDISIFDVAGNLLETTVAAGGFAGQQVFFGVWSPVPIGEINVAGQQAGGELLDNIQLWAPEPATLGLLGLGAMAMLRRRR